MNGSEQGDVQPGRQISGLCFRLETLPEQKHMLLPWTAWRSMFRERDTEQDRQTVLAEELRPWFQARNPFP